MSETRICPFCGKETDKFIMFRGDIVGCRCCGISKKQTNADRIRAMTDEELAWELARICRMPFYKDDSEIDGYEVDCWAKWLKQEATDD